MTNYKFLGQTQFITSKKESNRELDQLAKDLEDFKIL
jgi:hypothetical protein